VSEASNCSITATHEHACWASPSTRLQLVDGDTQSEDPGKNGLGDPRLIATEDPGVVAAPHRTSLPEMLSLAIPSLTAPCGTTPMPGTSAVDEVRFLSSAQHFHQNPGTQNTKNQDRHNACTGKTMAGRTMDGPS
jgi:hypothetical protein